MIDTKRTYSADEEYNMEDAQKFLPDASSPNGDLHNAKNKVEFNGLSKEELMRYAADPTWVRIRWVLFFLFWAIWIAMLVSAILLIVFVDKCPYKPKLSWHQKNTMYRVDVEYFRDSNGDGVGDLEGLGEKVNYLNSLGIKALYLNDVLDGVNVNAKFGGKDALRNLYSKLKDDMNLILGLDAKVLDVSTSEQIVKPLFADYADGLIVKNVGDVATDKRDELVNTLKKSADEVSKRTARDKFLAFEPPVPLDANNSTVQATTTLDRDLLAVSSHNKQALVDILNEKYNRFLSPSAQSTENIAHTWMPTEKRVHETLAKDKSHIIQGLALLSYGSAMITYGDEIQLPAVKNGKHYMLWDSTSNCGFSKNSSDGTYTEILGKSACVGNVKQLSSMRKKETISKFFSSLIKLRQQEPAFLWGKFNLVDTTSNCDDDGAGIIAFTRHAEGFDGYLVVANTGDKEEVFCDFKETFDLPEKATVEYFYPVTMHMSHQKEISTDAVTVYKDEILLIKYNKTPLLKKLSTSMKLH